MGNRQKSKGDKFERELAAHINAQTGLEARRAPLSGGGWSGGGADLIGTPGLFIEAKRVEQLSFPGAMDQAERNKAQNKSDAVPVVINRRSRQSTGQSFTLLRLDDFLAMYQAWLDAGCPALTPPTVKVEPMPTTPQTPPPPPPEPGPSPLPVDVPASLPF